MDILILGGTRFVGRHIAEALARDGHRLTLFHRGQTGNDVLPEAEHVHGDRNTDLARLANRKWDLMIDTCAYYPRQVRAVAEHLRTGVERAVFVSTISVYRKPYQLHPSETHAVETLDDPEVEVVNGETYGGLKVLCEKAYGEAWGSENLWIVRPGLICGPGDHTDRFTYWAIRLAGGKRFVAPPRLEQPLQVIDARDLARFVVRGVSSGLTGILNVVGESLTYSSLFEYAERCWPDSRKVVCDLLTKEDEMPLILPLDGTSDGIFSVDASSALLNGLERRPIEQTIQDIYDWHIDRGCPELITGLSAVREAQLLA